MNSSADQNLEGQVKMCQIHNNEIIAVNLDSSITGIITHLCNQCLIDNTNNNKVLTILQAKEQIASNKKQKQQRRRNEIEIILTQLKNLFQNIEQFKCKVNTNLDKISNELSKQIKLKLQELSLSQNCLAQHNFWEDVQLLSEFISNQEEQMEIYYLNEMQIQFQQISFDIDYLQTIEAFKNAKMIINQFNLDNQIRLEPPKVENNTKTFSLSTLCKDHIKEVILFDIDSENILPEKRLACAQCFSNGTSQKYKTIEQINDLSNKKSKRYNKIDLLINKRQRSKINKKSQMNKLPQSIRITISNQIQLLMQNFSNQIHSQVRLVSLNKLHQFFK
ncbi:unnamed protein product [Paramecium octaurelia]|uniref:Uncharacterized protein n=1 Tax=Paramecium octaurelia TaxID=43137 RepID=A0A8S1XSZ6_PAROT|nr:unnamed protein product [Paramecium octaurelia]